MFKYVKTVRNVASGAQPLMDELARLLPPFSQRARLVPAATSFSSVAIAAARGSAFSATAVHSPDCPVHARRLPLGLIAEEPSFLKRPCEVCLAKRTHFVSSELFAREFHRNCCGTEGTVIPAQLETTIIKSFGGVEKMRTAIIGFCTGSLAPGRIWLVCRSDAKLAVVAMPTGTIPQTLGLWPVAVVDMSEGALCRFIEERGAASTSVQQPTPPPSWSRAARNPGSVLTAFSRPELVGCTLGHYRVQAGKAALGNMNWTFVVEQVSRASAYFQSESRLERQRIARSKQEQEATQSALRHLRAAQDVAVDDGDDSHVAATDEKHGTSSKKPSIEAAATVEQPQPQADVLAQEPQPVPDIDPVTVQLPGGIWEYRYKNGDITRLHSDGTKVFLTHGLTTTVFPNTDTLFEYENKTTILDRADGVRVTTFPDGRKTEERVK